MNNGKQEKSLIKVNVNNIFYKIKKFINNIFKKNKYTIGNIPSIDNNVIGIKNRKEDFLESIKSIENEQTRLLKLQKQYRSKIIKEKDLSQEQVNALCKLYDKQILELKKSNEKRKKKILEYKRNLQANN